MKTNYMHANKEHFTQFLNTAWTNKNRIVNIYNSYKKHIYQEAPRGFWFFDTYLFLISQHHPLLFNMYLWLKSISFQLQGNSKTANCRKASKYTKTETCIDNCWNHANINLVKAIQRSQCIVTDKLYFRSM